MNNPAQRDFVDREFPMTDKDFAKIKSLAYQLTGISLSDHKKNMVYGRLSRRLRKLNIATFSDYCDRVEFDQGNESLEFVNSITTNLTSFFRENHHFEFLKSFVLADLQRCNAVSKKIRIWSAGCSTGEEPYSLAMVLKSTLNLRDWQAKILATDLDSHVLEKATAGVYAVERTENIPEVYRRYLSLDTSDQFVRVKDSIRALITFKQLNLLHGWPMKGPFDVIFCRNVVIYFDVETQRRLFDRYAELLKVGGYLFIGHSENLHNISTRFKSLGRTVYQRVE